MEERREVLRVACLNAAEKITGFPPRVIHHRLVHRPNAQTQEAKRLCSHITELYQEADPSAQATERKALAGQCAAVIRDRLENGKLSTVKPLQDMRIVCQKLTGVKIACWADKACEN